MFAKTLISGMLALATAAEISSAQGKGGTGSSKADSVTGIIIVVVDPGGAAIPRVTWNSIDKATFQVQRSKVGDNCCNNTSPAGLTTNSWQDSRLPSAGTYTYRVIASLRSGQIAGQAQISFVPPAPAPTPTPAPAPTPAPMVARYEVVVQESPVGNEATKQLQVSCTGGRKALAAGWAALDGTGAFLDGNANYSEPSYDASSWIVSAQKVSTFTATWKLRVRAVCGSTDPTLAYDVAVGESAVGTEPLKQIQVSCPAGKTGLGAGWAPLDPTGAFLEGRAAYLEPTYDGSSWSVNAQKTSTYSDTWKLRVRAVCGQATSSTGYEVVVQETPVGGEDIKQLQAGCPAGKKSLGAGWSALDETGAILEGRATYFEPTYDASGWMVSAQKVSSFASTWKLRLRVVCGSAG